MVNRQKWLRLVRKALSSCRVTERVGQAVPPPGMVRRRNPPGKAHSRILSTRLPLLSVRYQTLKSKGHTSFRNDGGKRVSSASDKGADADHIADRVRVLPCGFDVSSHYSDWIAIINIYSRLSGTTNLTPANFESITHGVSPLRRRDEVRTGRQQGQSGGTSDARLRLLGGFWVGWSHHC